MRWATVIESVLKIVKAPTKIATPAEHEQHVRMIQMNCSRPFEREAVVVAAVCTWAVGADRGGDGRGRRRRDAVAPGDEDRVVAGALVEQRCARVARSNTAALALPSDLTSPKRAMPTTVDWRAARGG